MSRVALDDYDAVLRDVQALLQTARDRAYQAVDNIRVQAYWQIGERIVRAELKHAERADYGARIIEALARDLGMTRQMLARIVRFYRAYPVMTMVRAGLSWSHYELLSSVESATARAFYEGEVLRRAWSVRHLEEQIRSDLYQKSLQGGRQPVVVTEVTPAVRPDAVFHGLYTFDIPGLPGGFTEAQLEAGLKAHFERFLEELGPGFYVRKSQQPIVIDGQYHAVDLELYCRAIPCIVLVELKIGPFQDAHVGQVNKYVSYYREHVPRHAWEQPTIGLLICESAGQDEVRYALAGLEERIFVAEYRVRLPDEQTIKERLEKYARGAQSDESE